MSEAKKTVEEIWVDVYEAAELTGYNIDVLRKLASHNARQPEDMRAIKVRKRTSRWEIWLPDLIDYTGRPMNGPRGKRENKDSI